MLKWLRSLGKTGETIAWILAIFDTKVTWAVVVSAAFGIFAALWTGLFDFFNNQHTQIATGVFLATFWTYIGWRVLRSLRDPIRTLPEADYRYCISPEGLVLVFDPQNTDLAFSLVFGLRNVGNWPIRIRVESFDARIQDRAAHEPDKKIELVIPRI